MPAATSNTHSPMKFPYALKFQGYCFLKLPSFFLSAKNGVFEWLLTTWTHKNSWLTAILRHARSTKFHIQNSSKDLCGVFNLHFTHSDVPHWTCWQTLRTSCWPLQFHNSCGFLPPMVRPWSLQWLASQIVADLPHQICLEGKKYHWFQVSRYGPKGKIIPQTGSIRHKTSRTVA